MELAFSSPLDSFFGSGIEGTQTLNTSGLFSKSEPSEPISRIAFNNWVPKAILNDDLSRDDSVRKYKDPVIVCGSFAAGGLRGAALAEFAKEVKIKTSMEPAEIFDYMGGTSAGAIMASFANVRSKDNPKKPAYQATDLIRIFKEKAPIIFPQVQMFGYHCPRLNSAARYFKPEYAPEGLKSVLETYLGDETLADGIRPIVITASEMTHLQPWIFTQDEILIGGSSSNVINQISPDEIKKIPAKKIIKASAAAPTFFPPEEIIIGGEKRDFRDGCLFDPNPVMSLFSTAFRLHGPKEYLFCSIGTGDTLADPKQEENSYSPLVFWGTKFPEISMNLGKKNAHTNLRQFLPGEGDEMKLFEFNPMISEQDNTVDDISEEHFNNLANRVQKMIEDNYDQFEIFCRKVIAIRENESTG